MLPLTPWLLAVWYAREAGAPWWATLVLSAAGFALSLIKTKCRPWVNALRALSCLALAVYVASRLLPREYAMLSVALLVANALLDAGPPAVSLVASVTAVGAVLFFETSSQQYHASHGASAAEAWAAWALSVLAMSSKADGWHALCALTAPVLAFGPPAHESWTYCALVLPSLCLEQADGLKEGLAPMLAALTDARKRQDILLYCVAWAALFGLAAEASRLLLLAVVVLLPIVTFALSGSGW